MRKQHYRKMAQQLTSNGLGADCGLFLDFGGMTPSTASYKIITQIFSKKFLVKVMYKLFFH